MKKTSAVVIAVLLPCIAYAMVVALTERVFWNQSISLGKEKRAALAIRDDVTPFQKWGSRQFTLPYLDKYYGAAWYFTQTHTEDCKRSFLSRLDKALELYPDVDLFLLGHSNEFIDWVLELPPERRSHIRLVYNTGCTDLKQGPLWLKLGARAYVGHPGISLSPVFYFYFLRRWIHDSTLREAIDESNDEMRSALTRAEFFIGNIDVAGTMQESQAFCYGNKELRF